jgi:BCD family chlorophyll transporter-like MFS transporter
MVGIVAFSAVIFAAPLDSPALFRIGAALIGFGGGLFAVSTLTVAMSLEKPGQIGLALGAWGAVQATAAGVSIAVGGALRDVVTSMASQGMLGTGLSDPSVGYSVVYHLEIALMFAALIAIGPLVRMSVEPRINKSHKFGLAEFPG